MLMYWNEGENLFFFFFIIIISSALYFEKNIK